MTGPEHLPAFDLGGAVPALARVTDWSATPLGPVAAWPASLRAAINLCLASRFPMALFWGPELTMVYNDGYALIMGPGKHPRGFARPAVEAWGEIWPTVEPIFAGVLRTGEPSWEEDLPLAIERGGRLEQAYFTFSYSAVHGEHGEVAGILDTVVETTERVLSTRRLHLLSALGSGLRAHAEPEPAAACVRAARALSGAPADVVLVGLYLAQAGAAGHRLVAAAPDGSPALPATLDDAALPWPRHGASPVAGVTVVELGIPGCGPGLLVELPGPDGPVGRLLAGIDPLLPLDAELGAFLSSVAERVGTAVAVAAAVRGEREAAAALRAEQAVLAEVIERAPAGICLWWGADHRYRLVNRRYQDMVPEPDLLGRPVAEALPELATIAVPVLDAVRATGLAQTFDDLPLPMAGADAIDGNRFYSFDLSAIPGADGRPGGVLGVTVETTAAVRRRAELERALIDERQIAETLQRALLPRRLPDVPGASLAARYEAAGERFQVGGDFYDAFENGDGTWTLIVGDVQGKGARAAALTAMARYTIRAEAAHGAQPGRLVAMLNDELNRHRPQEEAQFCTMVCATIAMREGGARMRVAVAGHPSPVVLRAGRGPRVLETTGPLVGILRDASWTDVAVALGPGDAVVFYTDGLTEARAPKVILEPVDLAASLAMADGRSADELVSRLAAGLPGAEDLRDDYAILAFSLDPAAV